MTTVSGVEGQQTMHKYKSPLLNNRGLFVLISFQIIEWSFFETN